MASRLRLSLCVAAYLDVLVYASVYVNKYRLMYTRRLYQRILNRLTSFVHSIGTFEYSIMNFLGVCIPYICTSIDNIPSRQACMMSTRAIEPSPQKKFKSLSWHM
jgi:hypothetical protein